MKLWQCAIFKPVKIKHNSENWKDLSLHKVMLGLDLSVLELIDDLEVA